VTYCPPERSPRTDLPAPTAPQRVAARGKGHSKRGGRRGRVTNAIHATAHERHEAWLEGGRPNDTYRLTRELDGLYDEHRDDQAGTLVDPYYGRTWKPR
jgi:hypothetical protein